MLSIGNPVVHTKLAVGTLSLGDHVQMCHSALIVAKCQQRLITTAIGADKSDFEVLSACRSIDGLGDVQRTLIQVGLLQDKELDIQSCKWSLERDLEIRITTSNSYDCHIADANVRQRLKLRLDVCRRGGTSENDRRRQVAFERQHEAAARGALDGLLDT